MCLVRCKFTGNTTYVCCCPVTPNVDEGFANLQENLEEEVHGNLLLGACSDRCH